jgi:hypothetical protein
MPHGQDSVRSIIELRRISQEGCCTAGFCSALRRLRVICVPLRPRRPSICVRNTSNSDRKFHDLASVAGGQERPLFDHALRTCK